MAYDFTIKYAGPPINGETKGWSPEDPITANKMNNIEAGIVEAWNRAFDTYTIKDMDDTLTALRENLEESIDNVDDTAKDALAKAIEAKNATKDGRDAWINVSGALQRSNNEPWSNLATRLSSERDELYEEISDVNDTLLGRINEIFDKDNKTGSLANLQQNFKDLLGAYSNALRLYKYVPIYKDLVVHEDLNARFVDLETQIDLNMASANSAVSMLTDAQGPYANIAQRFAMIDGGGVLEDGIMKARKTILSDDVSALQTEIVNARGKNAENTDNTALSQRFAQDEALINQRLAPGDIRDGLTSSESNKVLSANQGRVLDEKILDINTKIGGDFNNINTVAAAINSIGDTAASAANSYTDTLLGNGFSANNTVTAAVAALNNVDTTLDSRLDSIEDELQDARPVTGTDPETDEPIYGTLDDRLDAIESTATRARTDINTIATELRMYDVSNNIQATNTRIDTIEENVVAIGKEIGMLQDEAAVQDLSTAVSRANTRIDALDSDLNTSTTGLKDRMTTVEGVAAAAAVASTVNSELEKLDTRLDAIDGGTALTGTALGTRVSTIESDLNTANTGLKARVQALEDEPKSATVVVDYDCITYDSKTGDPTLYTTSDKTTTIQPTQDADYLLQKADEKYYYWKYIGIYPNGEWNLISGGAGGGGTSSAIIAAELPTAENANLNTDYYIGTPVTGYTHYRFITVHDDDTNTDSKEAVIIGQHIDVATITNNIKKYNIRFVQQTVTNQNNEPVTENRLYLYEVDYGDSNDFSQIDWDQPNAPEPFTYVVLPAGMGGGGTEEVQFKVRQRTAQNLILPASTQEILLKLFYTSYTQDDDQYQTYNGHYTLRKGSTVIDDDDIMAANPTLINTVIDQTTGELYYNKVFDVTKYCTANVTTNFTLTISNGINNKTYTWSVQLVDLSITTDLDDEIGHAANEKLSFSVRPIGGSGTDKIVCVEVDNDTEHPITRNVKTSGDTVTMEIPARLMTEGPHLIKIYVKQIIGANLDYSYSEPIYKDIACVEDSVVLASGYRRITGQKANTMEQYKTLSIPYYLYIPNNLAKTVTITQLYNDTTTTQNLSLTTGTYTYIFKASAVGSCTITITCEGTSIDLPFTITESPYVIEPVTTGLVFDFNPFGYSNDAAGNAKFWKQADNANIYLSIPSGANFDWNNGGWKYDTEANAPYFCVKAGSRAQINYPLFYNGLENNGAEFKCIFKATNVKKADAVFLTSIDQTESEIFNFDSDVLTESEFKDYINVKEVYIDVTDSESNITSTLVAVCPINISADDLTTICVNKRAEIALQYDETYTVESRVVITDEFDTTTQTEETTNDDYSTIIFTNTKDSTTSEAVIEVETSVDDEDDDVIHYGVITVVRPIVNRMIVHRGLEMSAHATNIYTASGTLFNPYSEEDIIEFEYNIHKKINRKSSSYIIAYEDGVCSAPLLYYPNKTNTTFSQSQPGNIIIGSDDCDIWIYRMKFYNKELTNQQVLSNFYADAIDSTEMVARYERNVELYKDPTNTENILSTITPQSLARACPQLRVLMIEAPNLTGGKKSFIKNTNIRCIYKGGRPEDNWVALNAYHAGQGTTSDKYGDAGRNLDIMFGFNGRDSIIAEKKDNNYKFDNSYKSVLITGVTDTDNSIDTLENYITNVVAEMNEGKKISEQVSNTDVLALDDFSSSAHHVYLNGTGKINLTDESVPNSWFNIKVNIASSENANNALLQKRYDKYLPYRDMVPAMNRDPHIKNDMEFFNTVIFIRETGTPTEFTEDASIPVPDRPWHFYGIGNLGDSKKTDDSRVNIPNDPDEFCVEISDNGLVNSGFNSGVYYTDVDENGEGIGTSYTETEYGIKFPISLAEWDNENNKARAELFNFNKDEGWENSFEFRYDVSTKDGNTIADSALAKQLATARQTHNKEVFANMYKWVVTATDEEFHDELQNWFIEDSPLYWYLFTERYTMIDSRAKNSFWHYGKVYITDDEYNGTNLSALYDAIGEAATDVEAAEAQTAYDRALYIYRNRDTFLHGQILDGQGNIKIDYNILAQINNGYRFDLWDYDNDTALGINNNGKLVFDYGLEDIDKTESGGWVFNQANSVFWKRIRKNMYNELSSLYNDQLTTCWNDESLLTEFDAWQEQFPEELWRLDFERKYLRPYMNKGENKYLKDMANGRKKYQRRQFERNMAIYMCSKYITGQSYDPTDFIEFRASQNQHLNQACKIGIKPYGKMYINIMIGNTRNASPIRATPDEYVWINPKEIAADFYSMQTNIFNASHIQALEGLADMYIDTAKFSTAKKLKKLVLGKEYLTDDNDDYILDGSGNRIPYVNRVTSQLTLEANPILEELDIRNCQGLTNQLDLVNCINLKILHAEKTSIDTFNFADGGLLTTAYLPGAITSLELINLKSLSTINIASYQNLVSYINQGSPLVDSLTILNNARNLSIAKVDSINWTAFSNMNLLKTLYDKRQILADPTNITLEGYISLDNGVEYKTLELADYRRAWPTPSMIIDVSRGVEVKQYEVKFMYDDDSAMAMGLTAAEQEIYKYYVTETNATIGAQLTYIDDGQPVALDPISLKWRSAPERTMTEQYTYTFGEYDNGEYVPFSGWLYNGSVPEMNTSFKTNIIIYTNFVRNDRYYKFRWYMDKPAQNEELDESTAVATSNNITYGQGTTVSAPTVSDLRAGGIPTYRISGNTYKIFKGWDHLPLNITPNNQNIFAVWEEHTVGTDFSGGINLSELTPAELLEVCETSSVLASINQTDRMEIQLGYDGADITGEQLITPTSNANYLRISKNNYRTVTGKTPLVADQAFTLVLDFKFDINNSDLSTYSSGESILASCYSNDNNVNVGFKLFYDLTNNCSRISYGDTTGSSNLNEHSIILSSSEGAHNRNIIVLRHPANSPTLYVYYGTNTNGMTDSITEGSITLPSFTPCSRPIIFGACSYSNGSYIDDIGTLGITTGRGVIYWAKLWNKDLGTGECKQLANWCHEKMTFGIVQTRNVGNILNTPQTDTAPRMYLSSLSTSTMDTYTLDSPTTEPKIGWFNSPYRTMLNKRVFGALPIQLQSIAYPTVIISRHATLTATNFNSVYNIEEVNDVIRGDYISIPSYPEIAGSDNNLYKNEANGKLPWTSASNVTVLEYDGSSTFIPGVASERYITARFKGVPISYSPTVYKISAALGINIYSTISRDHTLNAGDIWESGDSLYVYATRAQVTAGAPVVQATSGSIYQCTEGGWVPASSWWLRSFTNGQWGYTNFMLIQSNGQLVDNTAGNQSCGIDYSIGF